MKTLKFICFIIAVSLLLPLTVQAQNDILTIKGIVKEASSKKPIENVTISVDETNIGTVTNRDGVFSIKIPPRKNIILRLSHLSYYPKSLRWNGEDKLKTIYLDVVPRRLQEVTSIPVNAKEVVATAAMQIPANYPNCCSMLSAFYRETIQKGKRYISISEACEDVFKPSYSDKIKNSRVRVIKGRKIVSPKLSDTVSVKLEGGPNIGANLDIVMLRWPLFDSENIDWYRFSFIDYVMIDGNSNYKIRFEPIVLQNFAMYNGYIYIDRVTQAITALDISTEMQDRDKVTRQILRKKPAGMRFRPQELSYYITYKRINGRSYLNYLKSIVRFQCDWKKRLFHTNYTVTAEAVITDHEDNPSVGIARKEAFKDNGVLPDKVEYFNDTGYWTNYNIIEPTESLEKAVAKLKKSNKK